MLKIEQSVLANAVQRVIGVIEARNTIPVLSNLLLVAHDGGVTITGTDMDLQVACSETAIETKPWRVTVNAAKFAAAVSSFKPGTLVIAPVDGKQALTVRMGRGVRTLATLPADDFPARKPLEGATAFSVPAATLARLLDSTVGAVSSDVTRVYLNGTFLHVADGHLHAAATDGHRMVRAIASLPDGATGMPDTIVPTKAVNLVRKLLAKHDGDIGVQINASGVAFEIAKTSVIAKIIDGTFPVYQRIIPPSDAAHSITLARDALVEPVVAVAAVVDAEGERKTRAVKFELGAADEHQVTAQDLSGASANEPLDCSVTGGAFLFAVNHQYLVVTAKLFSESATLKIAIQGPDAPMLITSDKDPDLIAVVMPMRA